MIEVEDLLRAAEQRVLEEVQRLLNSEEADVNHTVGTGGQTPLLWAAKNGHLQLVCALLKRGADVHAQDDTGKTALLWAVFQGYLVMTCVLLAAGSDVQHADNQGWAALHWAGLRGDLDLVRVLLDAGAKVNQCNSLRCTPLYLAAGTNQAKAEPIHLDILGALLERGAQVNQGDAGGQTPLHRAALHGNVRIVRWLLEHGADPQCVDRNGWSPLFLALENKSQDAGALLRLYGARDQRMWEAFEPPLFNEVGACLRAAQRERASAGEIHADTRARWEGLQACNPALDRELARLSPVLHRQAQDYFGPSAPTVSPASPTPLYAAAALSQAQSAPQPCHVPAGDCVAVRHCSFL